jgi:hypothetical protein
MKTKAQLFAGLAFRFAFAFWFASVLRRAFRHHVNGALEALPSVLLELNFDFAGLY